MLSRANAVLIYGRVFWFAMRGFGSLINYTIRRKAGLWRNLNIVYCFKIRARGQRVQSVDFAYISINKSISHENSPSK